MPRVRRSSPTEARSSTRTWSCQMTSAPPAASSASESRASLRSRPPRLRSPRASRRPVGSPPRPTPPRSTGSRSSPGRLRSEPTSTRCSGARRGTRSSPRSTRERTRRASSRSRPRPCFRSGRARGGIGFAASTTTCRRALSRWAGRTRRSSWCRRRSSRSSRRRPRSASSKSLRSYRRRVDADLRYGLELADAADALTLPRFRATDLHVETKPDLTPVTDADRATENMLRARIARERPGEGVLGEEEGDDATEVRWIVDPIDGTRNFSRGIPVWATLIALEREGQIVCGVASAPALGRRWWAARGEGAFANGSPVRVSTVETLPDASVSCTYARDLVLFEPQVWHARGLGDFWQHVLVAEGALDAAIDARLALWDHAALEPIVLEAGGRVGNVHGQFVSSNGLVHDGVAAALRAS